MKVKVKDNRVKRKIKLPPLGNRIIKTGIAVFICLLIFMLRGYRGLVTQSCVAAIICIQPYNKQTIQEGINRTLGTFLGGAWGLLFLYVLKLWPSLAAYPGLVFFLMSVGIVLALYSTMLTKKTDAAALTAIVYICI
ncbi:MAG: FUSC family protein, partial [Clostridiales bacterium]|nr:FUSC family protein [Candidatus Blautia equi]